MCEHWCLQRQQRLSEPLEQELQAAVTYRCRCWDPNSRTLGEQQERTEEEITVVKM